MWLLLISLVIITSKREDLHLRETGVDKHDNACKAMIELDSETFWKVAQSNRFSLHTLISQLKELV